MKETVKRSIFAIVMLLVVATVAAAPAFARPSRVVDDSDTVVLRGNIHPLARPEFSLGATDYALPMERMVLSLRVSPARQAELDKLLVELQDPSSPNFHHWLSPEEFGEKFGPEPGDIDAVTGWLTSHGFTVEEVARSRTWINFSGTAHSIERAFHTSMHDYEVAGQRRHANAQDPAIPRGLADIVTGVVSLHNFPRKMMNSGIRPPAQQVLQPDFSSGSSHFLAPGDFAVIYNVNALYSAGIDGTGQTIAIVGRTHPASSNWATFRSTMGLPANPPQVIVNGVDPGDLGADEDGEADLDVEWSGAVAKNATIKFVVSKSTAATDGVDLSAQYIVNNNLAPVMSTSFGQCEALMGSAENAFYNSLWQQAAAQGITSFVSSGDSGAAGCSSGSAASGSGAGVNGLASTPYNVAVGGTQFSEGAGSFWNSTNGPGQTSAKSYIPEVAWNESGSVSGGSGLWSTGGGVSLIYGKPVWQVSPGVPADGRRDLPDVSLSSAGHDAYLVQTQGSLFAIGGTSAASPSFAGLMALIVQKTGQRQGNANTRFYQLGSAQFGSGGPAVFHDITSGSNTVPGVTGFSCTAGYDLATGLGSVDASALVSNWAVPADFAISASPASLSIVQGTSSSSTILTTVSGSFSSDIALAASGLPPGASATFSSTTIAAPGSGTSTLTLAPGGVTPAGTYTVTVTGTGGGKTHTASVSLTVTAAGPVATGVVITPDQPGPHIAGTAVTFSAAGIGSTSYQYRFWLYDGTNWSMVQDYLAGTAWTMPASTPPGSYVIAVDVRTGSSVNRDTVGYLAYQVTNAPATGVTITPDQPGPHTAGTAVTFSAAGIGSTSYQYRFWLYDGTNWSMVQDYLAGTAWTMPASTPPGSYVIAVDVRTGSSVNRDTVGYLAYQVTNAPATGVTITPDQPGPHTAGTAVIFSAAGIGSTSYQYRFWLYNGTNWSMVQDYLAGAAWTMPASTPPGSYVIAVDVRTSSSVNRDTVGYLGYQIN